MPRRRWQICSFLFFLRMEQAKERVAFKEKEGQRRKLQLGHKDKSSTKNGHLLTLLSHWKEDSKFLSFSDFSAFVKFGDTRLLSLSISSLINTKSFPFWNLVLLRTLILVISPCFTFCVFLDPYVLGSC